MKNIILLIIISRASFWHTISTCEPLDFNFGNSKWHFPSTVSDAVKKHNLNYKPPGYYYNIDSSNEEVILGYHYEPLDFDDEYQPKEVLFPRKLHSYIFRFPDKVGTYDSLVNDLEKRYKRKFVMTKGVKDAEYAIVKNFEYNFLTISPCLTAGIKRSSPEKREKIITVRFMYDLPLGKMGVYMGSY